MISGEMFNKFKTAFFTAVGGPEAGDGLTVSAYKYDYCRPSFLKFSDEEVNAASDTRVRPLILPKDVSFPFKAGYCECINGGKSRHNEDQAAVWRGTIGNDVPYTGFAVFDGHGGPMVAVAAAKEIEDLIRKKLEDVQDLLLPSSNVKEVKTEKNGVKYQIDWRKPVSASQLIVGALEGAFKELDKRIGDDKEKFHVRGGCTALVTLFILGRVYTACAGDSRAIVAVGNSVEALSRDHTPTSERARICHVGFQKPELLRNEFTPNIYYKRPTVHDLGKKLLYRDPEGYGYSYRKIESEDLKMPLIAGSGKRARLMGTIGVTRGFGDHELTALATPYAIKPFLSAVPEIRILDVRQLDLSNADVIIMGSDGLFDVTSNTQAASVVRSSFTKMTNSDDRKYMCAAQDLVNYARGKLKSATTSRAWKKADGEVASVDDITAWVIPLLPYQLEFQQWLPAHAEDALEPCLLRLREEGERLPITCVDDALLNEVDEGEAILSLQ